MRRVLRTFEFLSEIAPSRYYIIGKHVEKSYVRPMQLRWREMFTSKLIVTSPWDRWDFVALATALFIFIWAFALKLKTFYDLGYSSDLFANVQLARSWLEGRGLLHDNCYGNYLAIHSCFLLLPLGLIAKPFSAPGLLFVLAASVGAAYFWATRILRLLGVDGRRSNRSRRSSYLTAFGLVLSRGFPWLRTRESRPGVMFNAVLFPASAADDRVNCDGNCRHQREGGRADSGSNGSYHSRR